MFDLKMFIYSELFIFTPQKLSFSIKEFFSECGQIRDFVEEDPTSLSLNMKLFLIRNE